MRAALIRLSDGYVENVINAGEGYTPPDGYEVRGTDTAGPGWTYSDGAFSPPTPDGPTPLARQMSVLDFMDRFTEEEQISIVSATMSNAPLKLWYDRMLAASFIDIDDERTITGVEALAPTIIGQDRVDEILGR